MEILARMGRTDEAFALFDKIIAVNDTIKNVEINARFDELRIQYEVEKHIAGKERNRNYFLFALGAEWRINDRFGIKLDGSLSCWSSKNGKVQKIWLLNPEVRWYLLSNRRFYLGVSGNYGEYNFYKYPFGSFFSKDNGYQGRMWSTGLTVGYQLCLSYHFSVDFNLGLGYTRSEYDSFNIRESVRVYKERNRTKNFWGPTQAGINLMWTFEKSK